MPQLEFRSKIAISLIKSDENFIYSDSEDEEVSILTYQGRGRPTKTEQPDEMGKNKVVGYTIIRNPE